jgi:acetyltransferase EpsM
MQEICIIGGGGHSKVIIDCLLMNKNYKIKGILDDVPLKKTYKNIPYLGVINSYLSYLKDNCFFIIAIGDLIVRQKLINSMNHVNWINVIHPSAIISDSVSLGLGIYIGPNVVINADTTIEDHCIINTGSIIEHDVKINKNVHLAPRTTVCGGVNIGENTFVGSGTIIINKRKQEFISIGNNNFICAGSTIVNSLLDNTKNKPIYNDIIKNYK